MIYSDKLLEKLLIIGNLKFNDKTYNDVIIYMEAYNCSIEDAIKETLGELDETTIELIKLYRAYQLYTDSKAKITELERALISSGITTPTISENIQCANIMCVEARKKFDKPQTKNRLIRDIAKYIIDNKNELSIITDRYKIKRKKVY